jgi:hypothetical protein
MRVLLLIRQGFHTSEQEISQMKTSNRPTNGPFKKTAMALLISSALAGCSGGGGGGPGNEPPKASKSSVSVSGTAIKGILANATVEAYDISGTTLLATATTNDKGKYSLPAIIHDGPILVKLKTSADTKATCDSAVGCKDSNGNMVAFGETYDFNDTDFSLSAVLPDAATAATQSLMVTPITHMAAQRVIKDGYTSSADIKAINVATASLLGLDGIDINTVAPVDITDPELAGAGTSAQQSYAALVASIQTIAEKDPDSSIADVVNRLADDYALDGGLTSNSEDASKITLKEIFSNAIEVVATAEQAAADADVALDLGNIEVKLGVEENGAAGAVPDTEETVEPDPEETDPEETDPEVDTDTSTPQSRATAKGIALLNDLNTWQDALTADNQSLVKPFEDQLTGTGAVLKGLEAQTKILQGFYSLVAQTNEEEYCSYFDGNGTCIELDTESETEPGHLIKVIDAVAALVQLTGYLQAHHIDETSFDYGAQLQSNNSFELETLTDLISEPTEAENEAEIVYSLIAAYETDETNEDKIKSITYTVEALDDAETYDNAFSITLSQTDFNDEGLKISFNVDNATFNVPSEGLVLSMPTGEASMSFATANDRKAYSAHDENSWPSLAALTALDIHIASHAIETKTVGEETLITTGNIALNLDYDRDASNATTSVISFGIDVSNNKNEKIKGDLILTGSGAFSETESEEEGFSPLIDIKDASVAFIGDIAFSGSNDQGIAESASFNGEVNTETSFMSVSLNPATDSELLVDLGRAEIKGTIAIMSDGDTTSFTGNASVDFEVIKTPDGKPFSIDGAEYHANKAALFGRISTQQETGESASVEINAVVTADIEGMAFPEVNIPKEGDLFSQLHYGINSVDADNASFYINYKTAYDDGIANLTDSGLIFEEDNNSKNFEVSFSRDACSTVESEAFDLCDVTSIYENTTKYHFPTGLTLGEKEKHIIDNDTYSPPSSQPVFNPTNSVVDLTVSGYSVSDDSCYPDKNIIHASWCSTTQTSTGNYTFPEEVAITDSSYQSDYLRGLDNQKSSPDNSFTATCDDAQNEPDNKKCAVAYSITATEYLGEDLTDEEKKQELKSRYNDDKIELGNCSDGICEFTRTGESDKETYPSALGDATIALVYRGQASGGIYYLVDSCTDNTCEVTEKNYSHVLLPNGLTTGEKQAYVEHVANGYTESSIAASITECTVHSDYDECNVTTTKTTTLLSQVQHSEFGLTKYIADIRNNYSDNIIPYYGAYFNIETQYGDLYAQTSYMDYIELSGEQDAGETVDKTIDLTIEDFYSEFEVTQFDTEDAFVEMSAALRIKADLTGLDDGEITIVADRLGLEDFSGSVKLVNGVRTIALTFNTKELSDATETNLQISNANALMTINATCATDANDDGTHSYSGIMACDDGVNFQGDVVVDGLKVADLEDRGGFPVFRFSDGTGLDLVATPNLLIQPSK